jgi:hypothetical protein
VVPSNLKQQLYLAPKKASTVAPPKAVSEIKRAISPNRVSSYRKSALCFSTNGLTPVDQYDTSCTQLSVSGLRNLPPLQSTGSLKAEQLWSSPGQQAEKVSNSPWHVLTQARQ